MKGLTTFLGPRKHSGLVGAREVPVRNRESFRGCPDPVPIPTTITMLSETGEFVMKVATGAERHFAVRLKPGAYWLIPEIFDLSPGPYGKTRTR